MALGKGSLKRAVEAKPHESAVVVPVVNNIVELDVQTLKFKKVKDVENMVQSIGEFGVIVPVVVVKEGEELKVTDGVKRLSALLQMGVNTVKAVIVEKDGKKVSAELKKFEPKAKEVTSSDDIREEKFNAIKKLGQNDMPFYLL